MGSATFMSGKDVVQNGPYPTPSSVLS